MAGSVQFSVNLFIENEALFPELKGRAADLRPAFQVMVRKWAQGNRDKFARGVGAGRSGVQDDPGVYWQGVSDAYWRRKMKAGFPDNLMERTGELRSTLSDPEGFFSAMTAEEAVFGTPLSHEDEMKVVGNARRRQTIFLSNDDKRMIEATLKHYFELGEDFEKIMFAQGLANVRGASEAKALDINFDSAVAAE